MPNWEEWNHLSPEAKEYSLFKILNDIDSRLDRLENRRILSTGVAIVTGFIGGFAAVVGKWILWR
jgi:hypothetical protein